MGGARTTDPRTAIHWWPDPGDSVFLVQKSFYLMHRDLVVFTGLLLEGDVGPGMLVDLLAACGGPGLVAIHSVEPVRFADGSEHMAITVPWDAITPVPLFEPSSLEGQTLSIRVA